MTKFKTGDKVKIIQRKPDNTSGAEPGWNIPNGNVGDIAYVDRIKKEGERRYNVVDRTGGSYKYYGWFDEDDLELVADEISTTPYVKGKWYSCKKWTDEHNFVKLDYVNNDQAYFTECIFYKEHKIGKNWWSIVNSKLIEADMSIVSQFLPDGHPDKIDSKEFVLPDKWCIKITEENIDVLGKWRTDGPLKDNRYVKEDCYLHTPMHNKRGYNEPSKHPDYKEITFEQFKQYVLKESLVVETPKEIDMQAIQEEAKKRFPIGCMFFNTEGQGPFTLQENNCTYYIENMNIWAQSAVDCLYKNGKWATLISFPKTRKEMFYKGDYIVTLINDGDCGKVNYCSKQRQDSHYLKPDIDTKFNRGNGNSVFQITDTSNIKWRYATPEEAAEYERIGKPYDVTTLQKNKKESIPEYVECVKSLMHAKVGKIYKVIDSSKCESDLPNYTYSWRESQFNPSTKEAYEAQFKEKELTKEDLVKGEIYIYNDTQISIYPEGPSLSIKEKIYVSNPNWLWALPIKHATEEQKALLRSYIKKHEKINSSEAVQFLKEETLPIFENVKCKEGDVIYSIIKKETFIENVQSVNVMLCTKKKSIKF
jgi:hypothetical protein